MQLGIDVVIKQTQKLTLTPQMEQALSLLQMNTMELNQCVEEELLSNPMLIEKEGTDYRKKTKNSQTDYENYMESLIDENNTESELKSYLKMQLYTKPITKQDYRIAEYLIECLEETGYLKIKEQEIAKILHLSEEKIQEEIAFLQKNMEPCGVFARDGKECLLLQIEQAEKKESKLYQLVSEYLEEIADNKIPLICKKTGWEQQEVLELIEKIKKLEPVPGRGYGKKEENTFIYPDITVSEEKGIFQVTFNRGNMKAITLNQEYLPLLNQKMSGEETRYVKEQYQNARMLIKNIAKREETLQRVSKAIIEHQIEFFQKGKAYLKPLNLSDIAMDTELHESTVSRAVHEKYLECRWGIFELKYFFSNKLSEKNAHSCIEELVKNENSKKPYSDSQLAEKLQEMGIQISRRTVAKYREQLAIPNAQLRKKYG